MSLILVPASKELLVIAIADNPFDCLIERSLTLDLYIAVQKDKVRIPIYHSEL